MGSNPKSCKMLLSVWTHIKCCEIRKINANAFKLIKSKQMLSNFWNPNKCYKINEFQTNPNNCLKQIEMLSKSLESYEIQSNY